MYLAPEKYLCLFLYLICKSWIPDEEFFSVSPNAFLKIYGPFGSLLNILTSANSNSHVMEEKAVCIHCPVIASHLHVIFVLLPCLHISCKLKSMSLGFFTLFFL